MPTRTPSSLLLLPHLAALLQPAAASLSSRGGGGGDGCLPADVVAMLKGEVTDAVAFGCRKEIQEGISCSADCHDAIVSFQEVRRRRHQPWA